MVYQKLLSFGKIDICGSSHKTSVDPINGVWLQHNPPRNLLAILAVNRLVYYEARRVFYGFNIFSFTCRRAAITFLIGIGRENVAFLQTVRWSTHDKFEWDNHIDTITSCIAQTKVQRNGKPKEVTIWNNEDQFVSFLQTVMSPEPVFRGGVYRLLRLDADDVSNHDSYDRHTFQVRIYESRDAETQKFTAAYELRSRRVKDDDPLQIAALQALEEESQNKKRTKRRRRRR
jgi:hypothetical protein